MRLALFALLLGTASLAHSKQWNCRNSLEIRCEGETCEASGEFTPMDVTVDEKGAMNVCAYSGCWEGAGKVLQDGDFLVLVGQDLKFSTATSSGMEEDIVLAIDKQDRVAVIKAGSFAMPLACKSLQADN